MGILYHKQLYFPWYSKYLEPADFCRIALSQQERSVSDLAKLKEHYEQPFKPVAFYHRQLNFLEYVEKDCIAATEYIPGSNIELLRENGKGGAIVGVIIHGYASAAQWNTLDATIMQFPAWFRFLYRIIKNHRDRKLKRDIKALGLG